MYGVISRDSCLFVDVTGDRHENMDFKLYEFKFRDCYIFAHEGFVILLWFLLNTLVNYPELVFCITRFHKY